MLRKRYIAIKNNPRWLPPTLLICALGPGTLLYSTHKGLFMSLSLLCSIHKWKDTRNRLDVGTRQGRGLTLMTLSLCLRSEHSVTWNVLPWRRRASRPSSTKPSSLFSTPRKKRKAVPSATAAVQLSEVAQGPSPRHPRVRRAAASVTQLQPKTEGKTGKEFLRPEACPVPCQFPSSALCQPLPHPQARASTLRTEDAEPHSDSAGEVLEASHHRPVFHISLPQMWTDRKAWRESQAFCPAPVALLHAFAKFRNTTPTFFLRLLFEPRVLTLLTIAVSWWPIPWASQIQLKIVKRQSGLYALLLTVGLCQCS